MPLIPRYYTVTLRCSNPECNCTWDSPAIRHKEEWGYDTQVDQEYCPECDHAGEIIDDDDGRVTAADWFDYEEAK